MRKYTELQDEHHRNQALAMMDDQLPDLLRIVAVGPESDNDMKLMRAAMALAIATLIDRRIEAQDLEAEIGA